MTENQDIRAERLLTSKEVCEILSIRPRTLAAHVAAGLVPSLIVGRRSRRYREADIRQILESGSKES
jgi:predicted site-specific integrase-resolvase